MAKHIKTVLIATASLGLAACASDDPDAAFNQEAGAFIDGGTFGNPTMNNTLIQTGQMSYVSNLNQRFSSEVPSTVNFEFDSARLTPEARAALTTQANWIRQFPEVAFRVYGHTDLVGPESYNRELGRRRAEAVVAFLASQGISRSRLQALQSFGESQPLVATEGREMRNRRAVTEVSGFVQNHPMVLHGKYAQVIFRDYVRAATEVPTTGDAGLEAIDSGSN